MKRGRDGGAACKLVQRWLKPPLRHRHHQLTGQQRCRNKPSPLQRQVCSQQNRCDASSDGIAWAVPNVHAPRWAASRLGPCASNRPVRGQRDTLPAWLAQLCCRQMASSRSWLATATPGHHAGGGSLHTRQQGRPDTARLGEDTRHVLSQYWSRHAGQAARAVRMQGEMQPQVARM